MPKNWKTYKLNEKMDIGSSKRIFRADYVSKGIPFYRSKEIIQKARNESIDAPLFIDKRKFEAIQAKYGSPQELDILISSVGNRSGIPYLVQNETDFYFKDGNLIWFKNFEKEIHSPFLYQWLTSNIGQSRLRSTMIGSAQKALTIEGIKSIDTTFPPLPEQKAIASILSTLDDKIENNLAMNKTLEEMAMALYKHWFVDFGPFQKGKFIDSELGKIPEGWEVKELGDIFNLKHGYAFKGKFFTQEERRELLLTPGNFERNGGIKFNWGKQKFYEGAVPEDYILNMGELVLALTDLTQSCDILGAPAFIPDNDYNYLHNQRLGLIELKDNNISKDFIFCIANSMPFREYLKATKTGSTVSHTSPTRVYKFKVALPPTNTINFIYDKLKKLNEQKFSNLSENKTLTKLRHTLLPKLISGEVRLKEFEEEITTAL